MDWLFGIDMGVYYDPNKPAIVPDAFLSLGVERFYDEELRPSYVLWDEKVIPQLVIEIVSPTYRQEHTTKLEQYEALGVLYYVIYSSQRRRKPRLEIHKLINGKYELQFGNPVWLPEIGLGIGCERGNYSGVTREWLYWYDEEGRRYPTPKEQVQQQVRQAREQSKLLQEQRELLQNQEQQLQNQEQQLQNQEQQLQNQEQQLQTKEQQLQTKEQQLQTKEQQLQQEAQRSEKLAEKLRQLGIDPDNLS
jgi:DNA repair exonuclease SbcCD ATPase subunit